MNQNLEIEYKMLVTREEFETLLKHCQTDGVREQLNVYYDCTPSSTLRHVAMRIRDVDGHHWFTLKAPQPKGVLEYEMEIAENSPEVLDNEEIRCLFQQLKLTLPVHECGRMRTRRHWKETPWGELCLDHSLINGRDDYEIEFEISGDPDTGKAYFLGLLAECGLTYRENNRSKYARCVLDKNS